MISNNIFVNYIKNNYIIILFILILIIIVALITYFIIKYLKSGNSPFIGYSFYDNNILEYKPLFKLDTHDINKCIDKCNLTHECKGITFNLVEEECYGTGKDGVLRTEEQETIQSWVKQQDYKYSDNIKELLKLAKTSAVINYTEFDNPVYDYQYSYNMFIYIKSIDKHNKYWKHILHKGTPIDNIKSEKWSDIELLVPDQYIGIWLSPYNTTLRIAIKNKIRTEFIDIKNMPINKLFMLTVNIYNRVMEVYIDTQMVALKHLTDYPKFNRGDLYIKNQYAFNGYLTNISYKPSTLSHEFILNYYNKNYKNALQLLNNHVINE